MIARPHPCAARRPAMPSNPCPRYPQADGAPPRLLLTPDETAAALGVSIRSIMAWVADGSLPHVRLGKRCLRFSVKDLESFVQAHRSPAQTSTATADGNDNGDTEVRDNGD